MNACVDIGFMSSKYLHNRKDLYVRGNEQHQNGSFITQEPLRFQNNSAKRYELLFLYIDELFSRVFFLVLLIANSDFCGFTL